MASTSFHITVACDPPVGGPSQIGISGLNIANDALDSDASLLVTAGVCRDSINAVDITLPLGVTKRIDANWAAGSGVGGLDVGTVAPLASYHVFVIRAPETAEVDVLLSASPSNPVMPEGFTQRRRIGALTTDASGHIYQGRWIGGEFAYKTPFVCLSNINVATRTLQTIRVPTGIKVKARNFYLSFHETGLPGFLIVADPDVGVLPPDYATDTTVHWRACLHRPAGGYAGIEHECWTNSAGQLYLMDTSALARVTVAAHGWFDPRDEFA